jgi:F-box-like
MPLESVDLLRLSKDAEESTELVLGQLPVELVICIFILACNEQSIEFRATRLGGGSVSAGSTALALTGVCRRWRNISTSVPELWTRLGFLCHGTRAHPSAHGGDFGEQGGISSEVPLPSFLQAIILRSGSHGLQIKARHPHPTLPPVQGVAPCICSIAIKETQTRTLSLELQHCNLDPLVYRTASPRLQHISFRRCALSQGEEMTFSSDLNSIVLRNEGDWFIELARLKVSWASLSTLSLFWNHGTPNGGLCRWEDLFAVLRQTAALSTLKFNMGTTATVPACATPLYLPYLSSLVIQDECLDLAQDDGLFRFHTPSLQRFDYCTGYDLGSEIGLSGDIESIATWLSSLPSLQLFQLGILEDCFFYTLHPSRSTKQLRAHAFYLVPPSPPASFADLADRIFAGPVSGREAEGAGFLSDATVQFLEPMEGFWPEGCGVDDIFETVKDKTALLPHPSWNDSNFTPATGSDLKLHLQLLSSKAYTGLRSLLLHFPTP